MLTRLRVSGFKNLVDVDVRFGPFTCVAGANGVGKSNLFDAVRFLGLLADRPLVEAAQEVRGGRFAGVGDLFHRVGEACRETMSFEAEMIVPPRARDDLHQEATATITLLCYSLTLARRPTAERGILGPLEIVREELRHINRRDAHKHLLFKHSAHRWRHSAVVGERRTPYFISTTGGGPDRVVLLHQDGSARGGPVRYSAPQLPRTVLSGTNAAPCRRGVRHPTSHLFATLTPHETTSKRSPRPTERRIAPGIETIGGGDHKRAPI